MRDGLRIALVSPYDFPYPGGVTKHIINLAKNFGRQGHRVRIIAASSQPGEAIPANVIRISSFVLPVPYSGSMARVSLSPYLGRRIRDLLQRESFDIVHLHEPMTPTLPWAAAWATRKASPHSALVGTFHAYRETAAFPYKYARPIFDRVAHCLDGRIAVSAAARDYISAYFPGAYQVIPNGVDVALFGSRDVPPLPQFADGLNTLFVGRLEPRKGFHYLVEAFARVKAALPTARLLVVGPYSAEDRRPYERELARLRLGDVHFVGYVSDDELVRYYRSSHVLCAPSTGFESFGMVLLEAMAAGVPVVASDIAGYRSVLSHQVEGLLLPPRDAQALADGLISLLDDPELRLAMARRGQANAARYAWDQVSERVLDCYYDTLERKRETGIMGNRQIVARGYSSYRDPATL